MNSSVGEHLARTSSPPFDAGQQGQIALRVIVYRGIKLLVTKSLREAKG